MYDPLETLMGGAGGSTPTLDEASLMAAADGYKHACHWPRTEKLTLGFEGNQVDFGGTIHTQMEGDECTAAVTWDTSAGTAANCSSGVRCDLAEAFEIVPGSVTKDSSTGKFTVNAGKVTPLANVPTTLKSRAWPSPGNKRYDRASAAELCDAPAATEPKDAADNVDPETKLNCRQSKAGDWMGWKWYKFVEQPSMQRLGLTGSEKAYMQARIERLHAALQPNAPLNDWLKKPADGSLPKLVEVDDAQLVVPPAGLETGYVPVVVYQGLAKHADCVVVEKPTPCDKDVCPRFRGHRQI